MSIIDLVLSDDWPRAVPDEMICDNDCSERAGVILGTMRENIGGKKFLDYGCGQGLAVREALARKSKSIGYDLIEPFNDWNKVLKIAPFDFILVHDVLDHLESESPVDVLRKLGSVLADKGRMYIRCEPWCSRQGGHLYKQLNKAYIHLLLYEDELKQLNLNLKQPYKKVLNPLSVYNGYLKESELIGFATHEIIRLPVEPFFKKHQIITDRLCEIFETKSFPENQLTQMFVDFRIKK